MKKPKMVSKKAERIYSDTRFEIMKHKRDFGNDFSALSNMIYKDNERLTKVTIEDIQKIIISKRQGLDIDKKLNIRNNEEVDNELDTIQKIENTLNNRIKEDKEFLESL